MEKLQVQLSSEDKTFLKQYIGKGNHPSRAIRRARMLLMLDEALKNQKQIALDCSCSQGSVTNLLKRYATCKGVIKEVLEERPRSGQPTIITPQLEANITALACCGEGPDGRSCWTLDLMASKMVKDGLAIHLSYETVRKVLKKSKLKPWLKKQWCIGKVDGQYLANMEGVLELYSQQEQPGVVRLCMDERPCQLLSEVMIPLPPKAATQKRIDNEYKREGTCVVLLAYDIDRGLRYGQVRAHRGKKDYAEFVNEVITAHYPDAERIKLVQDNLNTHSKGSFYENLCLQRAGELNTLIDFVYTPKHGSWLNMAEVEFSALCRQCLDRRIATIEGMKETLSSWTENRNHNKVKIHWSFTVDIAREKLASRYQKVYTKN